MNITRFRLDAQDTVAFLQQFLVQHRIFSTSVGITRRMSQIVSLSLSLLLTSSCFCSSRAVVRPNPWALVAHYSGKASSKPLKSSSESTSPKHGHCNRGQKNKTTQSSFSIMNWRIHCFSNHHLEWFEHPTGYCYDYFIMMCTWYNKL